MMLPTLLSDGRLRVPKRAESDGVIGDGYEDLEPGTPEFERWMTELKRDERSDKQTDQSAD